MVTKETVNCKIIVSQQELSLGIHVHLVTLIVVSLVQSKEKVINSCIEVMQSTMDSTSEEEEQCIVMTTTTAVPVINWKNGGAL